MLRYYKYRIYPSVDQQDYIDKSIDVCRLVYNLALEAKICAWQSSRVVLSEYDLGYQLTELRKEYRWISNIDVNAQRASIRELYQSYESFFKGNGFPRFKSKKGHQSFRCPYGVRRINWDNNTLTIPKLKNIPIVLSRTFQGDIKIVTIIKTITGKYFASILVNDKLDVPVKPKVCPDLTIGVDIGIKTFAVCSSGVNFEANNHLKNSLKRLRCLQQRAARKNKGSKNHQKANNRVAILHEKISNQRSDYIHKVTTNIVRDSQATSFVIEDLNVSGMVKMRTLSRSISDCSFGEFRTQVAYKCELHGKNLIVIDRFAPSSKRCSDCGEINQGLTLTDREWTCICGSHHDRDLNAAKNIQYFGLQQILNNSPVGSRGEPAELRRLRRAKKQEAMPISGSIKTNR